ncbi:MAG TPA: RNA 3'-terminal phosphate cyclase [Nitrososphaerales archaeon]|nr:RNA 3'-terminal phosphate cyclase [Nitrososphaerales archaeon]
MEFLEIDGAYGEGGGQILRTAVAFSIIRQRPIRVSRIRAGRSVPGIRPQHAASLALLAKVSEGELIGGDVGSTEVTFSPGRPKDESLTVDMRTAASTTLALQAVIPAVALSRARISLRLIGGTDVPWSPPIDYFSSVVMAGFRMLGISFDIACPRRGYYPKGGGIVESNIEPSYGVKPLHAVDPPKIAEVRLQSRCSALPRHVAQRQADSALSLLKESGIVPTETVLAVEEADSPGSSAVISSVGESAALGGDAIGRRGRRAEEVGREAAETFLRALRTGACFDSSLADMLAPLLSLAGGASEIRIPWGTPHILTSIHVAQLFVDFSYELKEDKSSSLLRIMP